MKQALIFTSDPAKALDEALAAEENRHPGSLFILTDENSARCCLPLLKESRAAADAKIITIGAGDSNKNIRSLEEVWTTLTGGGATRGSVMVNLGGGMVTDLGGFAAATFKRGIRFINIPTTLLSAVDAAVGGKTGINFCGLKNEIGSFREAETVIISAAFYSTLPYGELLSGYGEVLKHALIDSPEAVAEALKINLQEVCLTQLEGILQRSVRVKQRIVAEDPFEHGIRRALNLGHTAAHAFEALAMERRRPLAHGIAVAHGLVTDLVMSHLRLEFPSDTLHHVASFVRDNYPAPEFTCKEYGALTDFMRHDKKNRSADAINFTLLSAPGEIKIDCLATDTEISAALDITRDLLGC